MAQSRSIQKTCVALAVAQAITLNTSDAATFLVTNGFDMGVGCTMREALANVNSGVLNNNGCFNQSSKLIGSNDTIEFSISSITDLSDTLEITNDVTINPNGGLVSILGNGNDRVFKIESATVTMNSVSISGGLADDSNGNPQNSAEDDGGGIFITRDTSSTSSTSTASTLTLNNSTVTGNTAARNGGGINVQSSTVILDNSTVSNNEANNHGGGVFASATSSTIVNSTLSGNSSGSSGGALYTSYAGIDIEGTDILNNDAGSGAGIFADNHSILTVDNASISKNRASSRGGGIVSQNDASVRLNETTVSSNTSTQLGGGVQVTLNGHLSIDRSTLEDNSANLGGALFLYSGHAQVYNSTISNNEALATGGIYVNLGNLEENKIGTLSLLNSTVSDNYAQIGAGGVSIDRPDKLILSNTIISGNAIYQGGLRDIAVGDATLINNGFNLFGDASLTSAESFYLTLNPNDITATSNGTDPTQLSSILEPLADNGGPTITHALPAGSPAINAANNSLCLATPINNIDQRDISRSNCDIGAYEFQQDVSSFFVISLPNGKSVVIEL